MTEVHFYHLTSSPLERALPKLLEKALQGGFKTLILAESEEKAEWFNTLLWTYDPASFLPHGVEKDGNGESQPIFITAQEKNPNQADLLVITDGSTLEFDSTCRRVLDIFDGNDEAAIARARARWKQYQTAGHCVFYTRQTASGGWEKQAAA